MKSEIIKLSDKERKIILSVIREEMTESFGTCSNLFPVELLNTWEVMSTEPLIFLKRIIKIYKLTEQ